MKRTFIVPAVFALFLNSWGATSSNDVISYSTVFKFPLTHPGVEIQVTKNYNIKTGNCTISTNSPTASTTADIAKLEEAEHQAIRNKFGAINGTLIYSYQNIKENDSLKVMVTLKEPEGIIYLDKIKNIQEDLVQQAHTIASIQPVVSVDAFLHRYGFKPNKHPGKKNFQMNAKRKEIESIMFDNDVASIDEIGDESPTADPEVIPDNITTLASSAYFHSTLAIPSSVGAGVRASTWEIGVDPNVFYCVNQYGNLNINHVDNYYMYMRDTNQQHSNWTYHCLVSAAPGADSWHRQNVTFNGATWSGNDTDYFINNSIQTASMSLKRGGQSPYPATNFEFESMDNMAYYYPYPVFCNPAGNDGYKYIANWQCYNAINVGNVVHSNLTHFMLDDTTHDTTGCTQTKNPPPVHGSRNDREMPSLVAPGFAHHDYCVDNASMTFTCGTSFSAPIVNGLAADVISADTRMYDWPEKVRAVLLATSENVDRGYWDYTQDGRDGAGVVHGATAVYFAQHHTTAYPNSTAVRDGIAADGIYASDFIYPNNGPIYYNIAIPNPKPVGQHLRVVLTWDSNPVENSSTNALSDLDLMVGGCCASMSYNSNIEMVDVPINAYAAGTTVSAKILKQTNYIPTSGSRTNYFYYCIAWTWVNDHAE